MVIVLIVAYLHFRSLAVIQMSSVFCFFNSNACWLTFVKSAHTFHEPVTSANHGHIYIWMGSALVSRKLSVSCENMHIVFQYLVLKLLVCTTFKKMVNQWQKQLLQFNGESDFWSPLAWFMNSHLKPVAMVPAHNMILCSVFHSIYVTVYGTHAAIYYKRIFHCCSANWFLQKHQLLFSQTKAICFPCYDPPTVMEFSEWKHSFHFKAELYLVATRVINDGSERRS